MSNQNELTEKKCYACSSDTLPLQADSIVLYLPHLKTTWQVLDNKKISQTFTFSDFKNAIAFVNQVASVAEQEGHHPDISIYYNKVEITLWTHKINGLSENDFILAAKIEQLVHTAK